MDEELLKQFFMSILSNQEDISQVLVNLFNKAKDEQIADFKSFLTLKDLDQKKALAELDAKYAAQKQAEQDKILLEQAKIDEILSSSADVIINP